MRRVGEPVQKGVAYRHRAGVYAVLFKGGEVLMTHQAVPIPEFQLPGGGVDPGEHPMRALHREVYEETGWTCRIHRKLGVFQRYAYMPEYDLWARKICAVYLGQAGRHIGPPTEPDHTAIWAGPEMAHDLLANAGDRMMLARAQV